MTDRGLFQLQSADDLCGKLKHDHERIKRNRMDAYAAFDFVVTAWALAEWRYGKRERERLASKFPILRVCQHLANGAKHFLSVSRSGPGQPVVRSVWSKGTWAEGTWAPGVWDWLAVRLDGKAKAEYGAELTIIELADHVMKFWTEHGGCPPGVGSHV
jgi:hypothetical protein